MQIGAYGERIQRRLQKKNESVEKNVLRGDKQYTDEEGVDLVCVCVCVDVFYELV